MAAQIIAEFKALGAWCVIHGPEIWLGVAALCLLSAGVALGLWLAALLRANGEDINYKSPNVNYKVNYSNADRIRAMTDDEDVGLLIKCLIDAGCKITKAKDGEGGIYLRGKKLTDEELMDCIMRPWEDNDDEQ